jgi:hypothetical protein
MLRLAVNRLSGPLPRNFVYADSNVTDMIVLASNIFACVNTTTSCRHETQVICLLSLDDGLRDFPLELSILRFGCGWLWLDQRNYLPIILNHQLATTFLFVLSKFSLLIRLIAWLCGDETMLEKIIIQRIPW